MDRLLQHMRRASPLTQTAIALFAGFGAGIVLVAAARWDALLKLMATF